jgi:hypothetical protein
LAVKCAGVLPERIPHPTVYLFGHTWTSQFLQAIHRFFAVSHRVCKPIAGNMTVLVLKVLAVRYRIASFHMVGYLCYCVSWNF